MMTIEPKYLLIPAFAEITGYSKRAVEGKIHTGVWIEGKHYLRAPDGRVTMNLPAYYAWVEGAK